MFNVVLSTLLAISIPLIWFVGNWFAKRTWQREKSLSESYWKAQQPMRCPRCGTEYSNDWEPIENVVLGLGPPSREFHCNNCGETASFQQESGPPTFFGFESQWRACKDCGTEFRGKPDTTCPVCGACHHEIVRST
jgi:hypothetical protein